MHRNYLKPTTNVIALNAEQMIAGSGTSGTIEDVPMHGGTNGMKSSIWDEGASGNGEETIWK